jgi:hypothetical protein
MKKTDQTKRLLLEQLSKTPIVEAACQKIGISRMTFYRWKNEDKEFAKQVEKSIFEGQHLVNDLAESQLIGAVKDRNLAAITYWLRHHHPDYASKLRIEHALDDENLTPEQEAVVREALRLAALRPAELINSTNEIYDEDNQRGFNESDDKG